MKKIYLLLFMLVLLSSFASAEPIWAQDTFEDGSINTTLWNTSGTVTEQGGQIYVGATNAVLQFKTLVDLTTYTNLLIIVNFSTNIIDAGGTNYCWFGGKVVVDNKNSWKFGYNGGVFDSSENEDSFLLTAINDLREKKIRFEGSANTFRVNNATTNSTATPVLTTFTHSMPWKCAGTARVNISEIIVCNDTNGNFLCDSDVSVVTASTTLIAKNLSLNTKTTFNAGENFKLLMNMTLSNGSVINNSVCNISLFNSSFEREFPNRNFSLCHLGCDFSSYTYNFTDTIPDPSLYLNKIYGSICSEQNAEGTVTVSTICQGNTSSTSYSSFALCSSGTSILNHNFIDCSGANWVSVTVSSTVPNSQRKRITNLNYDRYKTIRTETLMYNSSSGYYQNSSRKYEYYDPGTYNVFGNCTGTQFNASLILPITILGFNPIIFFNQINTSLGITNLVNNVQVEFSNSTWNFYSAVSSNSLKNVSYFVYDAGKNIYNLSVLGNAVLNLSSALFVDFNNTYSFNITACDTSNNCTSSGVGFVVNDTSNPVCSGFGSDTVYNNSIYTWNSVCFDQNFYLLNVSCDNGFNSYVDGLNTISYSFTSSMPINQTSVCTILYCDGHTAESISGVEVFEKDNVVDFKFGNSINTLTSVDGLKIDTEMLIDSVVFSIDYSKSVEKEHVLVYKASPNSYYFKDDKYKAWIVDSDSKTWFDLNNGAKDIVEVVQKDDGVWSILFTVDETNPIAKFSSIGSLNCVSTTQTLTLKTNNVGTFSTDVCIMDKDLQWVFGYAFIVMLVIAMWLINTIWIKIPFFGFIISLGFIMVTLNMYACNTWVGVICTLFGLMLWASDFIFILTGKTRLI